MTPEERAEMFRRYPVTPIGPPVPPTPLAVVPGMLARSPVAPKPLYTAARRLADLASLEFRELVRTVMGRVAKPRQRVLRNPKVALNRLAHLREAIAGNIAPFDGAQVTTADVIAYLRSKGHWALDPRDVAELIRDLGYVEGRDAKRRYWVRS